MYLCNKLEIEVVSVDAKGRCESQEEHQGQKVKLKTYSNLQL